jgi:hypothetical protein
MKQLFFLFMSLVAILGHSQNSHSTLSFSTNYIANSTNPYCNTGSNLFVESDSVITLSFFRSLDSNYLDQGIQHRITTSNFIIADTTIIWERNGSQLFQDNYGLFPPNAGIVPDLNIQQGPIYFYECNVSRDSLLICSIFNTQGGLKDSLIFTLTAKNRFLQGEPTIYNNAIYLFSGAMNGDSAFIESYNLNGTQLNSLTLGKDSLGNPIFPYDLMRGPISINPLHSSELIFETALTNRVDLFNVNSFSMSRFVDLSWTDRIQLANSKRWGILFATDYVYDSAGVSACGILSKMRDLNDPNSIEYLKYYSVKLDWSGSLLKSEEFGPENIDSRAYAMEIKDSIKYIVGSTNFSFAQIKAQEYRQVMLVRQSGSTQDSVLLFGNGNHVGLDVKIVGSNIFVLSENSNVWTNDSVFVNVTKIPIGVFTSVKKIDSEITSLLLYPNPTKQFIQIQNIKIGVRYRIFDLNGKVVATGRIDDSLVNVENLKSATYFIQLFDKNKLVGRPSMFIKQ